MSRTFRYGLIVSSNHLSTPRYQFANNVLSAYGRTEQLGITNLKCLVSTTNPLRKHFSQLKHVRWPSRWPSYEPDLRPRRPEPNASSDKPKQFVQRRQSSEDVLINGVSPVRWRTQTIEVPVGGNGTVALDISRPSKPRADTSRTAAVVDDILLYLPPGPLMQQSSQERPIDDLTVQTEKEYEEVLEDLASLGSKQVHPVQTTVVRVNYRLSGLGAVDPPSSDHRFPLPIHDASVALEWALRNQSYVQTYSEEESSEVMDAPDDNNSASRILLYGSHIGGSLALMLALTQPNDVHAVIVQDPMVDWVGLDEAAELSKLPVTSKRRSRANLENVRLETGQAANALIHLRTQLFRNPSGFFDPFASPLMFLRAPGRDTPLWRTARPGEEVAMNNNRLVEEMKREGGIEVHRQETEELISQRGYGPYDDDWHTADQAAGDTASEFSLTGSSPTTDHTEAELKQISKDLSDLRLGDDVNATSATDQHVDPVTGTLAAVQPPKDLPTSLHSLSLSSQETYSGLGSVMKAVQARRRKVLRRWPPIGRPEDVDLPWTRIMSRPPPDLAAPASFDSEGDAQPTADLSYVLHPQAKEMVDVMRRACFWGRDGSLGEERVQMEILAPDLAQVEVGQRDEFGSGSGYEGHDSAVRKAVEWLSEIRAVEK